MSNRNVWVRWEGEFIAECALRPSNEGAWTQYVPAGEAAADAVVAAARARVECFDCRTTWSGSVQSPPYIVPKCSRCGKPCNGGHWAVASGETSE